MLKKQTLFALIVIAMTLALTTGCKKESVCSEIKATLDGGSIYLGCFPLNGSSLDTNYFRLHTFRPNQQQDELYDLILYFKKEIGTQVLDTATNNVFPGAYIIFYKDYYTNRKTYSLYHTGTSGSITVTKIDESAKTVQGNFNGTLCEIDSANDIINITDGSFSARYQ